MFNSNNSRNNNDIVNTLPAVYYENIVSTITFTIKFFETQNATQSELIRSFPLKI